MSKCKAYGVTWCVCHEDRRKGGCVTIEDTLRGAKEAAEQRGPGLVVYAHVQLHGTWDPTACELMDAWVRGDDDAAGPLADRLEETAGDSDPWLARLFRAHESHPAFRCPKCSSANVWDPYSCGSWQCIDCDHTWRLPRGVVVTHIDEFLDVTGCVTPDEEPAF